MLSIYVRVSKAVNKYKLVSMLYLVGWIVRK